MDNPDLRWQLWSKDGLLVDFNLEEDTHTQQVTSKCKRRLVGFGSSMLSHVDSDSAVKILFW